MEPLTGLFFPGAYSLDNTPPNGGHYRRFKTDWYSDGTTSQKHESLKERRKHRKAQRMAKKKAR